MIWLDDFHQVILNQVFFAKLHEFLIIKPAIKTPSDFNCQFPLKRAKKYST